MKKISKKLLFCLLVVLLTISFISFIVPFPKTKVFWISYVFFIVEIAAQLAIIIYTNSSHGIKDEVYSWPIIRIGLISLFATSVCGVIFTVVSWFVSFPAWICGTIYIVILAITIILVVTTKEAKSYVEAQEEKLKIKTSFMNDLYGDMQIIISQCSNPKWKNQLEQLSDDIRFSDPVSSESLIEIESELEVAVHKLKRLVAEENTDVPNQIDYIEKTLAVRNRKCKMTK